jgi:hypothetical protein
VKPLLPLLADANPVAQVLVKEHLMASLQQPPMYLGGQLSIRAGVTDKDPGHNVPTQTVIPTVTTIVASHAV